MNEKKLGRPSLGITKKVSLTLSEDDWKWIELHNGGNTSSLMRNLVWDARQEQDAYEKDFKERGGIME